MYQQIVDMVKQAIQQGDLVLGERLPNQRELAGCWDVNRSTIVLAIDMLKSEGILESNGKAGTMVAHHSWSLFASGVHSNWSKFILQGSHRPNQRMIQDINHHEFVPGIIRLGTGELSPDIYPKEMQREVLESVASHVDSLNYEEPKGLLPLRQEICKYLGRWGIEADPDQVVIVSGALQALQLIALSIMPSGSDVLVENPSYIQSLNIFQSAGMNLKPFPVGGGIEAITERASSRKPAFIYTIPTYHNPTGSLMDTKARRALLEFAKDKRIPILEDDTYRELHLDGIPPEPIKAMDHEDHVLYMGTVSKTLAPGMRIGWVVGPKNAIERLADVKMQTDYGSSSLSQWAVYEWFRSGKYDAYLESVRDELRDRRANALALLEKFLGDQAEWQVPTGGFYVWVRLNRPVDQEDLFNRCWEKKVLLNPGAIYDAKDSRHIRISYAYASKDEMAYGLKILSEVIADMT